MVVVLEQARRIIRSKHNFIGVYQLYITVTSDLAAPQEHIDKMVRRAEYAAHNAADLAAAVLQGRHYEYHFFFDGFDCINIGDHRSSGPEHPVYILDVSKIGKILKTRRIGHHFIAVLVKEKYAICKKRVLVNGFEYPFL